MKEGTESKMVDNLALTEYQMLAQEEKHTILHIGNALSFAQQDMVIYRDEDKDFSFRVRLPINIIKEGQLMKFDVISDWYPVRLEADIQ